MQLEVPAADFCVLKHGVQVVAPSVAEIVPAEHEVQSVESMLPTFEE